LVYLILGLSVVKGRMIVEYLIEKSVVVVDLDQPPSLYDALSHQASQSFLDRVESLRDGFQPQRCSHSCGCDAEEKKQDNLHLRMVQRILKIIQRYCIWDSVKAGVKWGIGQWSLSS